nr:hypothetical protein [Angustibacter aerolatus]
MVATRCQVRGHDGEADDGCAGGGARDGARGLGAAGASAHTPAHAPGHGGPGGHGERASSFQRLATYPVYLNRPDGEPAETETVAEISAVTTDGRTLLSTDGVGKRIHLVDISDPRRPRGLGVLPLTREGDAEDEPTSVAVVGGYALVVVNTSPSYTAPSGRLDVVRISDRTTVRSVPLAGQPDSIAVAPSGRYAAIAIENERDEDATPPGGEEGDLPQAPAGLVQVLDLAGTRPASWGLRSVPLTDADGSALPALAGLTEPTDPEPEYITINRRDQARGDVAGERRGRAGRPAHRPGDDGVQRWVGGPDRRRHRGRRRHRPDRQPAAAAARARRHRLGRRPLRRHRERGRLARRHPRLERLRHPHRHGRVGRGQHLRAGSRSATDCTTTRAPTTRVPSRRTSWSRPSAAAAWRSSAPSAATSWRSTTSPTRGTRASGACCPRPTAPRASWRSRRAGCWSPPARSTTPPRGCGPASGSTRCAAARRTCPRSAAPTCTARPSAGVRSVRSAPCPARGTGWCP